MASEDSGPHSRYTTRLQKGGALLEPLRRLTLAWGEVVDETSAPIGLSLPSNKRSRDVVRRIFIPRWVNSEPPNLWRVAATLEHCGADRTVIIPLHYYATASTERLLWDFVLDQLLPLAGTRREVSTQTVLLWLDRQPPSVFFGGRRWSPHVATKVARGVLAALRDYDVLQGASRKHVGTAHLPVSSFAVLARIRRELGLRGDVALGDDVWKLFFLDRKGVERLFSEAASEHLLQYETAGPVVRIDFPDYSLEEYAEHVAQRTTRAS